MTLGTRARVCGEALARFHAMTHAEAVTWLRPCVDIDSWCTGLTEARPYADAPALLDNARALAEQWSDAEVEAALADHPRIGERHTGSGTSAAMSSSEQSGVGEDADVQERLRAGNARYEERFGRIYLVRAKGRSAEELLALLEERLGNDAATELAVTRQQLGEIAVLRLETLLAQEDS